MSLCKLLKARDRLFGDHCLVHVRQHTNCFLSAQHVTVKPSNERTTSKLKSCIQSQQLKARCFPNQLIYNAWYIYSSFIPLETLIKVWLSLALSFHCSLFNYRLMDCPLETTQKNCTYIICDVLPLRLLRSIRKNDGVIELKDRKEVAGSVSAD